MTADSTRGGPGPRREPEKPRWRFREVSIAQIELDRPLTVPHGADFVRVSTANELRLEGVLDPGSVEAFDSYLPTVRVGERVSSRMSQDEDGIRFTFYPEVDGEIEGGEIELRLRLGDEFEPTGLRL